MKPKEQQPTVGDALEAMARVLEAQADVLRRLADREDFGPPEKAKAAGDGAVSLAEAGRRLSLSRGFLREEIKRGRLKAMRHSPSVWRVPTDELDAYQRRALKSAETAAASPLR